MKTTKAEQISTLMDGEMSQHEMDHMIQQLRDNPHLKSCWHDYHLIGDALRHQLPGYISTDLHSRISAAIHNEPTHFLPRTAPHKKPAATPSHKKEAFGFALAASVTAIAVIGVMQFNQHADIPGQAVTVAVVEGNDSAQSLQQPVSTARVGRQEDKDIIYASVTTEAGMIHASAVYSQVEEANLDYPDEAANLYDYLVNYNEYARTRSLQGEMYPAIQLVGYTP